MSPCCAPTCRFMQVTVRAMRVRTVQASVSACGCALVNSEVKDQASALAASASAGSPKPEKGPNGISTAGADPVSVAGGATPARRVRPVSAADPPRPTAPRSAPRSALCCSARAASPPSWSVRSTAAAGGGTHQMPEMLATASSEPQLEDDEVVLHGVHDTRQLGGRLHRPLEHQEERPCAAEALERQLQPILRYEREERILCRPAAPTFLLAQRHQRGPPPVALGGKADRRQAVDDEAQHRAGRPAPGGQGVAAARPSGRGS